MADEILIRVRSTHDDPYEYNDINLSQETVTLEQLIQENESIFRGLGYIKINDAGKVDQLSTTAKIVQEVDEKRNH